MVCSKCVYKVTNCQKVLVYPLVFLIDMNNKKTLQLLLGNFIYLPMTVRVDMKDVYALEFIAIISAGICGEVCIWACILLRFNRVIDGSTDRIVLRNFTTQTNNPLSSHGLRWRNYIY